MIAAGEWGDWLNRWHFIELVIEWLHVFGYESEEEEQE
jgi:hypothetical protein